MRNRKRKGASLRIFGMSPALARAQTKSEGARELWRILAGIVRLDRRTHVNIEWHGEPEGREARSCVQQARDRLVEAGIPADVISTSATNPGPQNGSLLTFPGEPRRPRVVIVITQDEKQDAA